MEELPWSEEFVDITGNESLRPRFRTRVKLGWDDDYLYVGAELEEPHVWGTIRERNAVIFEDNDFEMFLDPAYKYSFQTQGRIDLRGQISTPDCVDILKDEGRCETSIQHVGNLTGFSPYAAPTTPIPRGDSGSSREPS